jgi:hypothetical protein
VVEVLALPFPRSVAVPVLAVLMVVFPLPTVEMVMLGPVEFAPIDPTVPPTAVSEASLVRVEPVSVVSEVEVVPCPSGRFEPSPVS